MESLSRLHSLSSLSRYKMTVSAYVDSQKVVYVYKKPIANFFEKSGLLRSDIVFGETQKIMETFRTMLKEAHAKKSD